MYLSEGQAIGSRIRLSLAEFIRSPVLLIAPFLFSIAAFDRRTVYLHVKLGNIPLYLNEVILLICLTWIALSPKRLKRILNTHKVFLGFLLAYISWGTLLFLGSFALHLKLVGMVPLLKNFMLVYLGIWTFVFLCLNAKEWNFLFLSALLGCFWANIHEWAHFLLYGVFSSIGVEWIGDPAGSYPITALFPLILGLVSPMHASLLFIAFGHTLYGQVLLYFKKSWILTFLVLALPAGLITRGLQPKKQSASKKLLAAVLGISIGCGLSFVSSYFVSKRPLDKDTMTRYTGVDVDKKNAEILKAKDNIKNIQDSKIAAKKLEEIREDEEIIRNKIKHEKQFNKIFESKITRVTESPEKFIFHGEDENSDERGTSGTLAWRKHLWNQALDGYHAAPLMGQGFAKRIVETLIWGSLAKMDGNWISGPHNSFLAIAFRMGIIGIFFLFCAIGIALYIGIINRKFNPISTLIFAGFIGIFAYANFNVCLENPQAGIWFWFFLSGLALSKLTLTETE